jgi:hypothetical protein
MKKSILVIGAFALLIGVYVKMKKPLGIRNNNPLNMREVGIGWNGKTGENGGFTTFEKPWDGIRAAGNDIKNKMRGGVNTISALITVWAPSNENDTAAYIESVSQKTAIQAGEPIASLEQLVSVITAMIYHENGQQPYDAAMIIDAVYAGVTSGAAPPAYFDLVKPSAGLYA